MGVGHAGVVKLCRYLDMPALHHKTFGKHARAVCDASKLAVTRVFASVANVVRRAYCDLNSTGLVVDYAVLLKYCVECELVGKLSGEEAETWKQPHADQCAINHTGSNGSMETEAAKLMWARSVELMDTEYTSLLGDGDAAVLSALNPSGLTELM